jgi:hypothetical protein
MSTALTVAGVLLVRPGTPESAAWIWTAAQLSVAPYTLLATARVLRARLGRQWRAGATPLALAGVAVAVASVLPELSCGGAEALAVRVATGGAVYVLACRVLLRGRIAEAAEVLLPPARARA